MRFALPLSQCSVAMFSHAVFIMRFALPLSATFPIAICSAAFGNFSYCDLLYRFRQLFLCGLLCRFRQCGVTMFSHATFPVAVVLPLSAMRCDAVFSVHLFPWPLRCPFRQCGAVVLPYTSNFVGSRLLSSTFPVAVVLPIPSARCDDVFSCDFSRGRCAAPSGNAV